MGSIVRNPSVDFLFGTVLSHSSARLVSNGKIVVVYLPIVRYDIGKHSFGCLDNRR